jgi:hypothetical protein
MDRGWEEADTESYAGRETRKYGHPKELKEYKM